MSEQKSFDYWDFFAGEAERSGAPLYVRLSQGVGGDPELDQSRVGVEPDAAPVVTAADGFQHARPMLGDERGEITGRAHLGERRTGDPHPGEATAHHELVLRVQ